MNKLRWKESSTALRKVLRKLPELSVKESFVEYKFGAIYGGDDKGWLVWNGFARHVVALVRFEKDKVIIRYRDNSRYAGTMSHFNYGLETIHVRSSTLRRYRRGGRPLTPLIQEEMLKRRIERRTGRKSEWGIVGINIAEATTWEGAQRNFERATRDIQFLSPTVLRELAQGYIVYFRSHRVEEKIFTARLPAVTVRRREAGENPIYTARFENGGLLSITG